MWMRSLVIVTTLCFVSVATEVSEDAPSQYFVQEMLVRAQHHLTTDVYKALSRLQGNLVVSPWSIMSLLTATYILAGGKTASEIEEHLKIPLLRRKELFQGFHHINSFLESQTEATAETVESISAALLGGGLHAPERLQRNLQQHLNTYINHIMVTDGYSNLIRNHSHTVSDNPEKIVNEFIDRKTRGLIQELLPPGIIDANQTALWLFNALYFQGEWQHKFHLRHTHQSAFKVNGNMDLEVKVPTMMLKAEFPWGHYPDLGMTLLELPYGHDGRYGLFLLLPDKDDELPQLERRLNHLRLQTVLSDDHGVRLVKVYLPKFKFHKDTDLTDVMKRLGYRKMFQAGDADFSRIQGASTDSAYVTEMRHKAVIEITEDGTTAAAASAIQLSARRFAYHFRVDHPFMFVLQDKRLGINLFVGRVTDPTKLT